MTTKRELAIGIVGGLILVVILMSAPPWMIIPALGIIYVVYRLVGREEPVKKAVP